MSIQQKVILLLLMVTLQCQGQLTLKATLRNDAYSARTMINETTGAIIPENIIPRGEQIVYSFDNTAYTRQERPLGNERTEPLKKYNLLNAKASETGSLQIPIYAQLTFFNNGAFALIRLLGEGSGYGNEIRFYNSDFQLIQTFIPYASGIRETSFHTDGKEIR